MTHTFRWNWKSIFGYLRFIIFFGLLLLFSSVLLRFALRADSHMSAAPLLLLSAPVVLYGIALLFFLSFSISQFLFAYLRVSPEGFEFRRWPLRIIQVQWNEVEQFQHGVLRLDRPGVMRFVIPAKQAYASLLIRRRTPGWEIRQKNMQLGSSRFYVLPLNEFEGWEDGSLEAALKFYAPHAFLAVGDRPI